MGTAAFMSPEQSAGAPLDTRSDMYSLGCTAFMALTGEPPYDGDSPHDLVLQHRTKAVRSFKGLTQDYDQELDHILMRTMAKHPQDRFPSMARLADVLGLASSGGVFKVIGRLVDAGYLERVDGRIAPTREFSRCP
jgi:serine/threonine-protein kinase